MVHNKIKESPAPPKIPPQKWLFDPLLHWLMGREHFGRERFKATYVIGLVIHFIFQLSAGIVLLIGGVP